jgi:hypothetical protein
MEDVMSKLSRRSLVAGAAAMPAAAVLPIAAQAVTEPDPASALIERFKAQHAILGRPQYDIAPHSRL